MNQHDNYEFHRERMEKEAQEDNAKKETIDDSDWDKIQDYYFENYASHNEDFSGAENWMEDLSYEECLDVIKRNDKNKI